MSKQRPPKLCAMCDKHAEADYRPFCSKRCADLDLHRWLTGAYAVPGEEDESASISQDDHFIADDRSEFSIH